MSEGEAFQRGADKREEWMHAYMESEDHGFRKKKNCIEKKDGLRTSKVRTGPNVFVCSVDVEGKCPCHHGKNLVDG